MSYENAPATRMLATHCASCGRPLVDSVSVNTGMGPDCRKRHGYGQAEHEPDWAAVIVSLSRHPELQEEASEAQAADSSTRLMRSDQAELRERAQAFANKLVHRIACDQQGPHVVRMTEALHALGFSQLAERIGERLAPIKVVLVDGNRLEVRTPYSEEALPIMRAVPGRQWDKGAKANLYPYTSKGALYAALKRAYPGKLGLGPKGFFQL